MSMENHNVLNLFQNFTKSNCKNVVYPSKLKNFNKMKKCSKYCLLLCTEILMVLTFELPLFPKRNLRLI